MQHLIAFGETQDGAAAYHFLSAVSDPTIFTSGDDCRVPAEIANIIGYGCLSAADAALTAARISSPFLRQKANINVEPIVNAEVFGSTLEFTHFPQHPIQLQGNESVTAEIHSNDSGTDNEYMLVMLSDGVQTPVTGDIFSIQGTASITLAVETWVEGAIDFEPTLPSGRYSVVGMRARGANLVAARLIFPGGRWRPGVAACNAISDADLPSLRMGRGGVLGEFDTNQPPSLEGLGITDSAQTVILDLIKVA